ncbi:MAG: hypothetical protein A2583_10300 [Bdellovibrionales bacterium RIFOXYD1_FULL_53_11]|nr:MAG: hypothetical protein A2583_10300 [Bdellovibrionales bacterium RIFOXYD1_FULL_53_11]
MLTDTRKQQRIFWLDKIRKALGQKSVVWLTGVRRAGKTTICRHILEQGAGNIPLYDCELPRIRRQLADPEQFFKNMRSKLIAIDEIHKLEDPSSVLKIAADYFPHIKVIAAGSSTLHARNKFKDTLTDRKRIVWLTPFNSEDMKAFDGISMSERMLKGGLPAFLLKDGGFDEISYEDWMDSFWAKDVQELFNIDRKGAFMKLIELLAIRSGGMFEVSTFASACEISRPTVYNYMNVLELCHLARLIKPFFTNKHKEVVSCPKAYFFDTGFVSYFNGWSEIHDSEKGTMLEHLVLNELFSILPPERIHYWRDKNKNEVDFILAPRGRPPVAIECKWNSKNFDSSAMKVFRSYHKGPGNLVVCGNIQDPEAMNHGGLKTKFIGIEHLRNELIKL